MLLSDKFTFICFLILFTLFFCSKNFLHQFTLESSIFWIFSFIYLYDFYWECIIFFSPFLKSLLLCSFEKNLVPFKVKIYAWLFKLFSFSSSSFFILSFLDIYSILFCRSFTLTVWLFVWKYLVCNRDL